MQTTLCLMINLKYYSKFYMQVARIIATGLVKYFSEGEVSEGYQNYESWLNDTAQQGLFYERIYRECL